MNHIFSSCGGKGGKKMELTQYGSFNRQVYVADSYLDTLLNQGEIFFKRSQYISELNEIEQDFGYIAKYRIAKNQEDQKSDASIHVHISRIDVKKKQDRLMTTTLAFMIHSLLEAYPDNKIEVSLHQSSTEVSYEEKNIYRRLLSQVFISGELPYVYDVFTVDNRSQDLRYYQNLLTGSKYEIGIVNKEDYPRLPIDRLMMKQEAVQLLRAMLSLDLEIHDRDNTTKNMLKVYRLYKTKKKSEKRFDDVIKALGSLSSFDHQEHLDQVSNEYLKKTFRYNHLISQLSDKEIREIYVLFKHEMKYLRGMNRQRVK